MRAYELIEEGEHAGHHFPEGHAVLVGCPLGGMLRVATGERRRGSITLAWPRKRLSAAFSRVQGGNERFVHQSGHSAGAHIAHINPPRLMMSSKTAASIPKLYKKHGFCGDNGRKSLPAPHSSPQTWESYGRRPDRVRDSV